MKIGEVSRKFCQNWLNFGFLIILHQTLESSVKIPKTLNLVIVKREQSNPEGIFFQEKFELFHLKSWGTLT